MKPERKLGPWPKDSNELEAYSDLLKSIADFMLGPEEHTEEQILEEAKAARMRWIVSKCIEDWNCERLEANPFLSSIGRWKRGVPKKRAEQLIAIYESEK